MINIIAKSSIVIVHYTCFFFQLVLDVSTTVILEPGPVINFIMSSQYINDTRRIDWGKVSYGLDDTDVLPR